MSIDGGTSYIRLIGDLDMMQGMCERIEVWEDGSAHDENTGSRSVIQPTPGLPAGMRGRREAAEWLA